MSLDRAIATLQSEVDSFGQGTKEQPAEDTEAWYLLRAKSLGLSMLKQMKAQGQLSPAESERMFRGAARSAKLQERVSDESRAGAEAPG